MSFSAAIGIWIVVSVILVSVVAAIHSRFQPQKETQRLPERGPLVCPYCDHVIADDVAYAGQRSHCPNCHASVRAPHKDGPMADPEVQQHVAQMGLGCLSVIAGIVIWWCVTQL
jgi:uncharacterized paraquat-inducible protein A